MVLRQEDYLLPPGHLGGAFDHHPVFGTMVVHLQREGCARTHHDAFDLETFAVVDTVVPAPRPMHLAMQIGFVTPGLLEPSDDGLDLLGTLLGGHQHCIGGFHHDHVFRNRCRPPCGFRPSPGCRWKLSVQTSPLSALSLPSRAMAAHRASQAPTSDQPAASGTTLAGMPSAVAVGSFSITA